MEGSGIYLRVGVLILGGVALLVSIIWFLGGAKISHGVLFESYFRESVQGMEVGSTVKYRGVTVGRVTDIGLVTTLYGQGRPIDIERQTYRLVFVRYVIDPGKFGRMPNTETAAKTGLRARLASQGLTGLTYIELDFVDPLQYPAESVPWTPRDTYIPSMPSTLSQVQDAAQQVLAKLNRVDIDKLADQVTALLGDVRTELATGDVHAVLAQADALLRTVKDTVKAADLPALTADAKRTSSSVRDVLAGPDVQRLIANASKAAEQLANTAARLQPLLASLQTTAQHAGNGTADVEQGLIPLLHDMQAVAQNLRELTESLRRYPAQVLDGQPPPHTPEPVR
jgi:paraquat-inducible protein B